MGEEEEAPPSGANNLLALKGCAGFGNQMYQYLGLAASMRVAREASLVDPSMQCEFVFDEARVGPSDLDRVANLNRAYELFSWPHDDCSVRSSFSRHLLKNSTVEIENLTLESIRNSSVRLGVYNINGNNCKFHSKSLCFLRGISTEAYWKALTEIAWTVSLRYNDNPQASILRTSVRNLYDVIPIRRSTLCVHVRGKGYEHHRGSRRRKVSVLFESLRLAIQTFSQIKHAVSHIHFITAMDVQSVWSESINKLSGEGLQLLRTAKVTIKNENIQMIMNPAAALANASVAAASATDNIYLDLTTMTQCPFLVIEEPLGRGTFSGTAALLSGKQYCTAMPWLLCNSDAAHHANFTAENPWSDSNTNRLVNPKMFRASYK